MSTIKTRADSIRIYLSGAATNGGAQSNPAAALGNHRGTTEVQSLSASISSPITNVSVDFVAGENGTGAGTLAATGVNDLVWTPPGGTAGPAVTIANGEQKVLEGGGTDGPSQFIRVTRTSASSLTGTATLTLSDILNNVYDNVSSAEATAGDNEYRCIYVYNEAAVAVASIVVYLKTLGTTRVSDSSQLGSSGAGTITTTGSFADWPDSGFVRIETSGGTERETVYYTSRTSTVLTVPAAGRALFGTSAAAGASSDNLYSVPGIRIAKEAPSTQPTGYVQTIANESSAPTGVTWSRAITSGTAVSIGTLNAGEKYGIWIHRLVVAGSTSSPSVLSHLRLECDAA